LGKKFSATGKKFQKTSGINFLLNLQRPQQGHVGSKTLHQHPPVVNWGCRLTQDVLYNSHKMVVVVKSLNFYY